MSCRRHSSRDDYRDHPETAIAIARELGIASGEDGALTGPELDKLSDADCGNASQRSPFMPVSPPNISCVSFAPGKRTMRWWR